MAFRSSASRERARQRRRLMWQGTLVLLGISVFMAIGYSAWRTGNTLARREVAALERDSAHLHDDLQALREENARQAAALEAARAAAAALQQRYDADVPAGALAGLVAQVKQKLAEGLAPDRLAQLLREARATQPCEGRFVRRRFAITTGAAAEDPASLLEGLITVAASTPAGSEDPKAATVTIRQAWAPQPLRLTGLPQRQSVLINNAELKLSIDPADLRGYATATLSVCGKG